MDQKLWVFEVFQRSLGRAGMSSSQPTRVDHMHKRTRAIGIKNKLHRMRLEHPAAASERPPVEGPRAACDQQSLAGCGPLSDSFIFFLNLKIK
jgi:hypothetical protein